MNTLLIGIPSYDGAVSAGIYTRTLEEARRQDAPRFTTLVKTSSLLANCCNALWATALNNRDQLTHFLMWHCDIVPAAGFLAQLLEVMERERADIVSAAVAIKNEVGLTSTALQAFAFANPLVGRRAYTRRRLTMTELHQLPETFDARTLAEFWQMECKRPVLLANTGLMLVNLRGKWQDCVKFEIRDALYQDDAGMWQCDVFPEDWNFTMQAQVHGARVVVTRAVSVLHTGRMNYPNNQAWGEWETDRNAECQMRNVETQDFASVRTRSK